MWDQILKWLKVAMHIEMIMRSKYWPALMHSVPSRTLPKNQGRIFLHLTSSQHLCHQSQIFLLHHHKTSCIQHLREQAVPIPPEICRNLSGKQKEVVLMDHMPQQTLIMNTCLMRFQTQILSIHTGMGPLTLLMHRTLLLKSHRMVKWTTTTDIHQEYLCSTLQVYPITTLGLLLQ